MRKAIEENPLSKSKITTYHVCLFLSYLAGAAGTICICITVADTYPYNNIFREFFFLISIFICERKRSGYLVPKGLSHSGRKLFWHRFFNIQIQNIYFSSYAFNFYLVASNLRRFLWRFLAFLVCNVMDPLFVSVSAQRILTSPRGTQMASQQTCFK